MKHIDPIRVALLAALLVLAAGSAAGQVLLAEDFDDGVADGFTPLSGDWEVVSGEYVGSVEGYEVFGFSAAGGPEWMDYRIELDLRVLGSINHVLRFRFTEPGEGYELNVRASPHNDVFLYKWSGGVHVLLASADIGYTEPGFEHHFQIELLGNRIVVFFDREAVFDLVDAYDPILAGGIQLGSFSGGAVQWQNAHYDNVLVEAFVIPAAGLSWSSLRRLY